MSKLNKKLKHNETLTAVIYGVAAVLLTILAFPATVSTGLGVCLALVGITTVFFLSHEIKKTYDGSLAEALRDWPATLLMVSFIVIAVACATAFTVTQQPEDFGVVRGIFFFVITAVVWLGQMLAYIYWTYGSTE